MSLNHQPETSSTRDPMIIPRSSLALHHQLLVQDPETSSDVRPRRGTVRFRQASAPLLLSGGRQGEHQRGLDG